MERAREVKGYFEECFHSLIIVAVEVSKEEEAGDEEEELEEEADDQGRYLDQWAYFIVEWDPVIGAIA